MFRLVVKSRELDAKDAKDLEAQAEVNFSLMEWYHLRNNLFSSVHAKCQAWPRIVATAAKNNIGAPAARALLEEVNFTIPALSLLIVVSVLSLEKTELVQSSPLGGGEVFKWDSIPALGLLLE